MAYRGNVIRLPIGLQGFSGSRNPTQLQAGHLQFVEGVVLDGGLIQKEGGATKLNASALGAPSVVISGVSYSPLASVHREAVFLSNGSILKDSGVGTFATTLASGLTSTRDPPPYFMMGGGEAMGSPRTLFLFSGTNQVRAVDGDGVAMTAITTPPADWSGAGNFPTFGVLHEGRLWGGGNASDPHRVYYSTSTDHQNFTGAGSGTLPIFPGKSERLVGGVSFKGLLILFKFPRGIYIVTTNDPSPSGWRVDELSSAVGSVNQHCIVPIDNDTLYMDSGGNLHLLSTTNAFGDAETSNISQAADLSEFMRHEVNLAQIRRTVGIWYGLKQQAWFGLPGGVSTDNSLRLVADFSTPQIGVRFLLSRRDKPISLWLRPDAANIYKPVHGDLLGFVWLMDTDSRNKDGVAYPISFETANMDLSFVDPKMATMNKAGDFLEIIFEPQGNWNLTVQVIWDDVPGPPLLFSMGGNSAALGVFILGTDSLSNASVRSIRKRIAGSGRRLRLMVDNQGLDQNVAISDFYLSFRTMDEKSRVN